MAHGHHSSQLTAKLKALAFLQDIEDARPTFVLSAPRNEFDDGPELDEDQKWNDSIDYLQAIIFPKP